MKIKKKIPFKEVSHIERYKTKSIRVNCSNKTVYVFSSFAQSSRAVQFIGSLWRNSGYCKSLEEDSRCYAEWEMEDAGEVTPGEKDSSAVEEAESRYEVFRRIIPMTPSLFETTFLLDNSLLPFSSVLEQMGCLSVTCGSWGQDELLGNTRELTYLAPAPGRATLAKVRTGQVYKLAGDRLYFNSSTTYLDFEPLASTSVEQKWDLVELQPEKSSLKVTVTYSNRVVKPDSELDQAIRKQVTDLAEAWYAQAKKKQLFLDKSAEGLTTHHVARYEEVDLKEISFSSLPKVAASYKTLVIYLNSLLLLGLLAYLCYLHSVIESRLSDPNCVYSAPS